MSETTKQLLKDLDILKKFALRFSGPEVTPLHEAVNRLSAAIDERDRYIFQSKLENLVGNFTADDSGRIRELETELENIKSVEFPKRIDTVCAGFRKRISTLENALDAYRDAVAEITNDVVPKLQMHGQSIERETACVVNNARIWYLEASAKIGDTK